MSRWIGAVAGVLVAVLVGVLWFGWQTINNLEFEVASLRDSIERLQEASDASASLAEGIVAQIQP